jgi:hypothetical protein
MRRRIAILLLILLPFQFSWSVAAGFCMHETGAAAKHFGHHIHVHQDGKDGKATSPAGQAVDSDCAACHLDGPSLAPAVPTVSTSQAPTPFEESIVIALPWAPPTLPERPNWTSPA